MPQHRHIALRYSAVCNPPRPSLEHHYRAAFGRIVAFQMPNRPPECRSPHSRCERSTAAPSSESTEPRVRRVLLAELDGGTQWTGLSEIVFAAPTPATAS